MLTLSFCTTKLFFSEVIKEKNKLTESSVSKNLCFQLVKKVI